MKTYQVEFLEPAAAELREIEEYYTAEFSSRSGKK